MASEYAPGAKAASFRVNVSFSNPFHPDFSPWNYGLKFRNDGNTFQMFTLDHKGNLNQINGQATNLDIVRTVPVPNMITSGGAINDLTFVVVETKAYVLLGQDLIGVFDVTEPDRAGEISLVTDVFNQTLVVGTNTEFFDLVINSAGLIGFESAGTLARQFPDRPATGVPSRLTSATYTRIKFVSPVNAFSGDYSYGLAFNSEEIGIKNWLILDDSKTWRHVRGSTTGAQAVLGTGSADGFQTRAGDENFLEFISTGEQHNVYLNGEFLTNIAFVVSDFPFTVAPMAAFDLTHQTGGMVTQFSDFAVWSIQD